MTTWETLALAGLAAGALVEVVRRWLWVAQRPSARVRDAGLQTLSVVLGGLAGAVVGDVLAGLAGGGLATSLVAGAHGWARRAGWAGGTVEPGDGPGDVSPEEAAELRRRARP